jgi:amino acid transporter
MAVHDERAMASEQVAPVLLSRVLGPFDLVVIFVAIVLFIINASTIQAAGPSAFVFWVVGFLCFLIPGAIVTYQLGMMFPQEGSLYVWTHKALGSFWGFFAGFAAWWPGIMVLVLTGELVVTLIQSFFGILGHSVLARPWEQGVVILAVVWFSAIMSALRFRLTQNYVNVQFVFYATAIFLIGLSGLIWVWRGHPVANSFALTSANWNPFESAKLTWFGFAILALLGIEVPLNMGVEVKGERSIKRYLVAGSIVVMVAYVWTTLGNMIVVPLSESLKIPTTAIITTVQRATTDWLGLAVAAVVAWFFLTAAVAYNYSFARLLFVSGLERRMPAAIGKVSRNKVPANAVVVQAVLASIIAYILFFPPLVSLGSAQSTLATKMYLALLATITVVWAVSMVLLFLDVFFVRNWFPEKFEEVRALPRRLLFTAGIVGAAFSVLGIFSTFWYPWSTDLFTRGTWFGWIGTMTLVSLLIAVVIFFLSERVRGGHRELIEEARPAAGA